MGFEIRVCADCTLPVRFRHAQIAVVVVILVLFVLKSAEPPLLDALLG
ncbi:hypothetical protein [Amycolatopsis nigrescens]|nr:hypothetical protein [Amycolatopsis nigrescens]